MNMSLLDWGIVTGLLAFLVWVATYTRRYNRSVADFLVANRCAGRYMIAMAFNMSGMGAISILAFYEMFYKGGFGAIWWNLLWWSVPVLVGVSGWLLYRYRQTRVLTLAQLFEVRYGKRFRIFAGMLSFLSGILNFGIFPAVGARFFIFFCGLPQTIDIAGIGVGTFPVVMIVLLSIALYFTFAGGQITIMVTDFIQNVVCSSLFIIIIIYLLFRFDFSQISQALLKAPADASLIHPFHSGNVEDFTMWYFLIGVVCYFIYNYISWQGSQGYFLSALTPTEQKIGIALSYLKNISQMALFALIAVCAYTIMHHPDFAGQMGQVQGVLGQIDSETIQKQMVVPVAMTTVLGRGLLGSMCLIVLVAFISTHDTYLHSWGSMFIQDIIMPFRKEPFTAAQHMKLLRFSITGVAVFIFLWSLFFPLKESILLYFAITGAVYIGGAGAVIIGALYWKRGTSTAAWWTMSVGSITAVSGIIVGQIYPDFPINSMWMLLITVIISCTLYVGISLLGKRSEFNMDRMLHRDKYALEQDQTEKKPSGILEKLGINKEFSTRDKLVYGLCIGIPLFFLALFTIGTIYNVFINRQVTDESWLRFWYWFVIFCTVLSALLVVWYSVGGLIDLKEMFRRLRTMKRDDHDDGMVADSDNLDE